MEGYRQLEFGPALEGNYDLDQNIERTANSGSKQHKGDFTTNAYDMVMTYRQEGWPVRRETAPFPQDGENIESIVKETPPNHTTIGPGVLETAETFKQNTSDTGCGVEVLESVQDFAVHHECNQIEQQTEADFAQFYSANTHSIKENDQGSPYYRQQTNQSSKKNYIGENVQHIKTIREIQNANSEKRKLRASEVSSRNHQNPWGYKFFGITENSKGFNSFQTSYRSQDWGKIIQLNSQAEKQVKKLADIKNQTTNLAFVEPEPLKETDPLTFAQSKKQKAWQKTNQSSINMLPSFKTLEANQKEEALLVPETQGNVVLATNLNRKSQLDEPTYGRIVEIPEEFITFKTKPEQIRNINNEHVMSGRRRTYASQVL